LKVKIEASLLHQHHQLQFSLQELMVLEKQQALQKLRVLLKMKDELFSSLQRIHFGLVLFHN
jgi:hypothetical protein